MSDIFLSVSKRVRKTIVIELFDDDVKVISYGCGNGENREEQTLQDSGRSEQSCDSAPIVTNFLKSSFSVDFLDEPLL